MNQRPPLNSPMPDTDWPLIQAALRGEAGAFGDLVRRYRLYVATLMQRFTRDALLRDELAQDVFIEAYLTLGGFRGQGPFSKWLRCIATRVGYRFWRQRANERRDRAAAEAWYAQIAFSRIEFNGSEDSERLVELTETLPPDDRLVLTLKYAGGLRAREIAQQLGWSETLVRVRSLRARRKLRALLDARTTARRNGPAKR